MKRIGSGALRHRLVLERPERSDDNGGGSDIVWQPVATVWAAIEARAGDERLSAGRVASSVSHDIVLRYRPDVRPDMRFRQGERIFHILAVFEPDDRRGRLKALCEERIAS